jgi:hypothetical protein
MKAASFPMTMPSVTKAVVVALGQRGRFLTGLNETITGFDE